MPLTHDEALAEIDRLKRRLERERRSRLEAESIAEKGLRDLYEGQQQLGLLQKIATAANQISSVNAVLQFALDEICAFADWEVGHSLLTVGDADGPRLRSTGVWHAADPVRIADFRGISEKIEFVSGVGLPGRALATGQPIWLTDVIDDLNFPRLEWAHKNGLRGASAFPVIVGTDVVAVLEFFTYTIRKPSPTMLGLLAQIGLQLGRVIERQRAEQGLHQRAEELARAEREAMAANRAKTEFLANMSHELRTPLNAIIGFSQMIRDAFNGPIDKIYQEYAADIFGAGRHLQDIVNDVLDISRVEVGRLNLREGIASINDIAEMCRRLTVPIARQANVEISFAFPEFPIRIRGDEIRLKQILLNVISNAIKFTPAGGAVTVAMQVEPEGLVAVISDTGIGMKPEDIDIALQAFRQVDGTLNRKYDGTGLGLPIAKALVDLHGGHLELESAPGVGTSVRIVLPRERIISVAA